MTDYNQYRYKYDLFLAENELFESLISTGAVAVLGETSTAILNESLNSKVNNYINKVMTGTQKVWDKYKANYANEKDMKYFKSIQKTIANANPHFTINNYKSYSITFLSQIKIVQFNYETMKDSLTDKDTFVRKYYPRLIVNNKVDIKNGMMQLAFTRNANVTCDKKLLTQSYNFCVSNFFKYRDSIEADIETLNKSSQNINNSMNSVSPAQESAEIYKECLNMVSESIILEAPMNPNDPNGKNKMTFSDSDGKKTDPKDKKKENSNKSFLKAVNVYMDVTTDIISAKMKYLAEIYGINKSIVTYYAKWATKGNGKNKQPENPNQKIKTNVKL